ncbi:MAG TPA: DUF4845 domain-containing protein [Steroidobacteraceae bacterium]|nr:DUF4845 domain-containing protein [Steroidobacteraceae bacterium]
MRKAQAGVTFIGWLVLLIPVAIIGYAAIRLIPIYLTQMKVASAVKQAADEARTDSTVSPAEVRRSITRRLDIEGVEYPNLENIRVAREGDEWVIETRYDQTAPLFGNIQLLVTFDQLVVIQ